MKKQLALVGFLLLAVIFFFIDFGKLFEVLSKTNLFFFFAAVFFGVPAVMARCTKWFLMLGKQGFVFSFIDTFKYYFIGIGLGTFTPGRLGDLVKVFFVNKKINSLPESFSSVLVDRIIDLSVLVFLGVISSIVFIYFFGTTVISIPLIMVLLAFLGFGFYLLFNRALLKRFLKPFHRLLVPERYKERLRNSFDSFLLSVQGLLKSPGLLCYSFLFSFLSWLFAVLTFYFLALALSINLSLVFLLLVMSLSTLVLLLPVSVSGIGTRDALMVFLFSLQGISPEKAVAFSFLVLFSSMILSLFGIALLATEKLELKEFLSVPK